MGVGVLNAAMLLGLLGAAVPVIVHLLNRRRDEVVDWGAMQFLELGERARRNLRLTELLLMLARMALLAIVALALARPYWTRQAARAASAGAGILETAPARDVVIVIDGSDSMERRSGGTTPRAEALRWARRFVGELRPGDSVAVLAAADRVRPLVDPPSFDKAKVVAALAAWKSSRGSSDLPAALAEAFRILERTQNPTRDVVVLTDNQRFAWRPGDTSRWELVRALHRRLPVPPRLWAASFGKETADAPNGALGPLTLSRSLVTPGLPVEVTTSLANSGPGPLTRSAELLADGHPVAGSAQVVGPVAAGGKAPLSFRTTLPGAGSHLLTVRLVGDDALPGDDEASVPVEVTPALPVLLVDGEPSLEPLGGETDFLRAALAPSGDDTPQVEARVVTLDDFTGESLRGRRVAVLANVARLDSSQTAAVTRFVEAGGGLLVALGDQAVTEPWNALDWMPAKLEAARGDPAERAVVARPAPRSFAGPLFGIFAQGDAPPLAQADLFAYRVLSPVKGSSVPARLDTGDPWAVERPLGKGRILLLAAPLDAEGGTLPVNPDFVPLVHEWIFHLAGGSGRSHVLRPGEPLVVDLDPPPGPKVTTLPVETPSGLPAKAQVVRAPEAIRARFDDTDEPGVYRLALPDPPGRSAFAVVAGDGREADPAPLEPAETKRLAEGWPLRFEGADRLDTHLLESDRDGRHEAWRWLVLAALGGLCLEIYLTRRLVRGTANGESQDEK